MMRNASSLQNTHATSFCELGGVPGAGLGNETPVHSGRQVSILELFIGRSLAAFWKSAQTAR
ncbi:hypothetical protein SBA3_1850020 [Candidatus Sulfopaludibacter sp. SbA3]|nr:hypothetical protein SBA3_1850020 [Candidatus Sulfopaludibacter sp. SbA3]